MKEKLPAKMLVILGCVAVIAFASGYFLRATHLKENSVPPIRGGVKDFKFINPLLLSSDSDLSRAFNNLSTDISLAIDKNIASKNIISASVYYRDLNSSRWTGVNENEKYAAASMYKVVTMMSLLKRASRDPSFLKNRITVPGIHEPITVSNLIYTMIVYSNNDSKDILESILKPEELRSTFSDFGLIPPNVNDAGDSLSPKEYSVFFRSLYNGNYLGHELSETALDILSRTEFDDGLVASVASTTVSHKFGYREFENPIKDVKAELHDCGIVYLPENPYFVCVMTKGTEREKLAAFIREVSGIVYKYTLENS